MSEKKPICGILAGEPEIIGERCADGGKCHHRCADTCWRRTSCAPLSGSGLLPDWSVPKPADPAPAQDDREAIEVVAYLIRRQDDHNMRGVRLHVDRSCYDARTETLDLMAVAQHERIVAALARPAQTAPKDTRAISMLVAEAAYKAGLGRDRSVASDTLREIVNSVFEQLGMQTAPQADCEWCAGAGHDPYGDKCQHCQTAPQPEQSGLTDGGKEAAMQKAFELGGLEDGSYHLESDELELVIHAALSAQGESHD